MILLLFFLNSCRRVHTASMEHAGDLFCMNRDQKRQQPVSSPCIPPVYLHKLRSCRTNDDEMVAPTGVDNGERDSSTSPTATTITTSTSHGDLEERLRGSAQMAQRFSKMEL
ncbi:unnamed protein product [Hymenolepis diminuta]|uniref:Secreted protein n=1 Tax=Hymenolepis diminuta TaxID=6216 RepID=A0A0R3SMN0_HYMDI|nr:unnamed protein product [Hymenolepis diminuta]